MLSRLERFGQFLEDSLLVVMLTAMILLATAQIVLRNAFGIGLIWSDELLRIMVLWLTFVGAVAASRDGHHIRIDVLSRFLPDTWRRFSKAVTDIFTALVCGAAAYGSFDFVRGAYEFEDTLLGGLPAWWFEVILPVGFGLIAWRYILRGIAHLLGKPVAEDAL